MSSPRPCGLLGLVGRDLAPCRTAARPTSPSTVAGRKFIGGEPMKPATNRLPGLLVELARRGQLLQHAALEHRHPVAEGHGLGLVVGDVDGGDAQALLQPRDLGAHLPAQLGVEVRQRLVEEERVGLADDRATHRHALALTARQVAGLALEVLVELEGLGGRAHLLVDLGVGGLGQAQRERDVLVDGEVRVERVVLEDHRQVAVARRQVVDPLVADHHVAGGDVLQARRSSAAASTSRSPRGPTRIMNSPSGDVDADVVDGGEAVAVLLDDVAASSMAAMSVNPSLRRR